MPGFKKFLPLLLLFALALFLRFYRLGSVPVQLGNDEISIAYDSYSVSRTLRDERGNFLPIAFQSHNTYKAPLYAYMAMIPIRLLGNPTASARTTSAVFGSFSVLLLVIIVHHFSRNFQLSLISGLVLATAPWHLLTSRHTLETNLALFFTLAGLALFLRSRLILSGLFFALSLYAYHTQWGYPPLLIFILFIFTRKRLAPFLAVFLITLLPLSIDFLKNRHITARSSTEMLWTTGYVRSEFQRGRIPALHGLSFFTSAFLGNYSDYLNPGWLFFSGFQLFDPHDAFNQGLLLQIELPFLVIGLISLRRYFAKNFKFLLALGAISPLIPALTQGGVSLYRDLVSVVPLSIFIAAGIYRFKRLGLAALTLSFLIFAALYFKHFPLHFAVRFQYGYEQIAYFLKTVYDQYDHLRIDPHFGPTNTFDGVPHLYLAYYNKMDPLLLQNRRESRDRGLEFAKYQILAVDWERLTPDPRTLYVVSAANLPPPSITWPQPLKTIYYPDGVPAF